MLSIIFPMVFSSIAFVEQPSSSWRIRVCDGGKAAEINKSKFNGAEKQAAFSRAKKLLERACPVEKSNPLTPLMGWSSWNTFALEISQEIIVGVAQAMATNGLKDAGYVYVNIDDGFFNGHDKNGRLRFHPVRFPNGLKGTVDGIHALGMKAGIYSDAGADTCGALGGDGAGIGSGLYGYDKPDCLLHFKELGFDFFKVDYCGGRKLHLEERARYTEIAEAIAATGRKDVRLNICRWAFPGTWASDIAGSWRTTRDIRASWESIRNIIAENLYLSAYARPGRFNDLDMLEVGQLKGSMKSAFGSSGDVGLTPVEETTHFGMWCLLTSPLVLGNDVRIIQPSTLRLVTNPFLVRMNQDPLGLQAMVVQREGQAYVLVKDAEKRFAKSRYVGLYNAGDAEQTVTVRAEALDLAGKIDVFDLVAQEDQGCFEQTLAVTLPAHGSRFFLFDAEKRMDRTVYEAETAYLTDYSELDDTPYGSNESAREQLRPYWIEEPAASGGVAIVNLGARATNDLIWKDVYVSSDAERKMVIRCRSAHKCSFSVQVDGREVAVLASEATAGKFTELSTSVCLEKGLHSVRLSNAHKKMPEIDVLYMR